MIAVNHLSKYFGAKKAVDDVSFSVEKGEILGFLGPNGAGKSTTMRMITGFLPPTSGSVVVGGHDVQSDGIAARRKMGYLPENAPVYPDMSVAGYLDFCARIRGFSGAARKRKVAETAEKCFLSDVRYQTVSTLSKGFKQRVCFAQSILHDPEYMILDEPTDGLDPNQKHEVRLMIREMSREKAIILSTHILDEVDAVCSRAMIIADGRIVADETPDGLKTQSGFYGAVTLGVAQSDLNDGDLVAVLAALDGVRLARIVETVENKVKIRVFPEDRQTPIADRVMAAVGRNHIRPAFFSVEPGRLDDVFRRITGADS